MQLAKPKNGYLAMIVVAVWFLLAMSGCQPFDFYAKSLHAPLPSEMETPTELNMVSLPNYRIEPPDVLQLDIIKLVPRPPYRLDVFDVIKIEAVNDLPENPISGFYLVNDEGYMDLGPLYGKVHVIGRPLEEAKKIIIDKLRAVLRAPLVTIQLARTGGTQQIAGIYLVQSDGVINLRQYGIIRVAGKTIVEVRLAIEKQLEQYYDQPQVSVNVAGYNSKNYYVIFEGTLTGENIATLPITGKETVLDAISRLGGLQKVSSKQMWIARPAPGNRGCEQILPVDYLAITRGGSTRTNYQLMPGDRLFVAEDGAVAANGVISKVSGPLQQLLGITQLAIPSIRGWQTLGRQYNQRRNAQ
jgi:polysaccharide export outer membrane protein